MKFAFLVGAGLLALLPGCREEPAAAGAVSLPDYPLRTLSELRDAIAAGEPADGPFLMTGTVAKAPDGMLLTEDVLLCCTGVTVGFRPEPQADWSAHIGERVAVFGRVVRAPDTKYEMRVRPGPAGFLAVIEGYVIEPEHVVSAESLIQRDNIVDTMEAEAPKVFWRALQETGVGEVLRAAQSITILAPVDAAFEDTAALFAEGNREELRRMVLRHVFRGQFSERQLMGRETINAYTHELFPVKVANGKLHVANTRTVFDGIRGSNGFLHLINGVLAPEDAVGTTRPK